MGLNLSSAASGSDSPGSGERAHPATSRLPPPAKDGFTGPGPDAAREWAQMRSTLNLKRERLLGEDLREDVDYMHPSSIAKRHDSNGIYGGFDTIEDLCAHLGVSVDEWGDSMNGVELAKLREVRKEAGMVPRRHSVPNSVRREKQKKILQRLAAQGMLKDFPNSWSSDHQSTGLMLFNEGASPLVTGLDMDLPGNGYDSEESDDEDEEAINEEDEEDDLFVLDPFPDSSSNGTRQVAGSSSESLGALSPDQSLKPDLHDSGVGLKVDEEDMVEMMSESLPDETGISPRTFLVDPNEFKMWAFLKRDFRMFKSVDTYNDILEALWKHGNWRRCAEIWKEMDEESLDDPDLAPNLETYTLMVGGYLLTGNSQMVEEAERLFGEMLQETDYRPDSKMFEALVKGYLVQKDYDAALGIFNNILNMSLEISENGDVKREATVRDKLNDFKSHFSDHSEVVDAFLEYDENNDGLIATVEVGSLLRRLGLNPTVDELTAMTRVVLDRDNTGKVYYLDYLGMMVRNDEEAEKRLQEMREQDASVEGGDLNAKFNGDEGAKDDFSWQDLDVADGSEDLVDAEEGAKLGTSSAMQFDKSVVTLECANAVLSHYASHGDMEKAWALFWKYAGLGLGNGNVNTYNTMLQGIAQNFHKSKHPSHGIHFGMSKDYRKSMSFHFDEMQAIDDLFNSMPEGPWVSSANHERKAGSDSNFAVDDGATDGEDLYHTLTRPGPVRDKNTYLHMLDIYAAANDTNRLDKLLNEISIMRADHPHFFRGWAHSPSQGTPHGSNPLWSYGSLITEASESRSAAATQSGAIDSSSGMVPGLYRTRYLERPDDAKFRASWGGWTKQYASEKLESRDGKQADATAIDNDRFIPRQAKVEYAREKLSWSQSSWLPWSFHLKEKKYTRKSKKSRKRQRKFKGERFSRNKNVNFDGEDAESLAEGLR